MNYNHKTVATNGVNLHVVEAGADDAPLVLLLHGFPEFWYMWRDLIPPLVAAGYRVWAPDMRGYHQSDRPNGVAPYKMDILMDDVVGLVEAAGVQQCILVGHDWGGAIAWFTAAKYAGRFSQLVVVNAPHQRAFGKALRTARQKMKSYYASIFQVPYLPEMILSAFNWFVLANGLRLTSRKAFSPDDLKKYKAMWGMGIGTMVNYYRALLRYPPGPLDDHHLHMPTLLIWGENDAFFIRDAAEWSMKYCHDSRLEFIENASHWVIGEQPERVTELLLEFLGSAER